MALDRVLHGNQPLRTYEQAAAEIAARRQRLVKLNIQMTTLPSRGRPVWRQRGEGAFLLLVAVALLLLVGTL